MTHSLFKNLLDGWTFSIYFKTFHEIRLLFLNWHKAQYTCIEQWMHCTLFSSKDWWKRTALSLCLFCLNIQNTSSRVCWEKTGISYLNSIWNNTLSFLKGRVVSFLKGPGSRQYDFSFACMCIGSVCYILGRRPWI